MVEYTALGERGNFYVFILGTGGFPPYTQRPHIGKVETNEENFTYRDKTYGNTPYR